MPIVHACIVLRVCMRGTCVCEVIVILRRSGWAVAVEVVAAIQNPFSCTGGTKAVEDSLHGIRSSEAVVRQWYASGTPVITY